ncbi:MAG: hypothetical protein WD768_10165 [Phycisphaeraceae bacterium]
MSARMAATTGDPAWEQRYRKFEPQLGAANNEAIEATAEVDQSRGSTQRALQVRDWTHFENARSLAPGATSEFSRPFSSAVDSRIHAIQPRGVLHPVDASIRPSSAVRVECELPVSMFALL